MAAPLASGTIPSDVTPVVMGLNSFLRFSWALISQGISEHAIKSIVTIRDITFIELQFNIYMVYNYFFGEILYL
jgi:hypothetical protein